MNINNIIAQLRTRAIEFGGRVGGAATFKILPEAANMIVPAAYVIPSDENPGENEASNGYRQSVEDSFFVIVVLDNTADERGQGAAIGVHEIRKALIRSIVGWKPEEHYDSIDYDGGSLLQMDRNRMYYQFEFKARYEIGTEDTWIDVRNQELPKFLGLDIKVDAIDVADPNHPKADHPSDPNAYPGGYPGPDGRIESGATIDLPQT